MRALKAGESMLLSDALYFADNGRIICRSCAGASATLSARDISGQKITRLGLADVEELLPYFKGGVACERRCTTLSVIAGPDGWPISKGRDA